GIESALRKANAVRRAIAGRSVTYQGRALGPITISAGVAGYPLHGLTPESLVEAADVALYRSKREGRDRVMAAGGIEQFQPAA
ncbi:MAG TPA: diguanylate cyclase, partial [Anaeromyxobacteraceae bacterium]|nr:diguanylate cyclase [Anaeromyxobacteraceae bacterium]